jgi:DNA polymerase III delta prime subunit
MARPESIISLDPIDRKNKKSKGVIGRFLVTRYGGGRPIVKMQPFGHYMFCGSQGSGKTSSALWYAEKLARKYKKKGNTVRLFSNLGAGQSFSKVKLFELINNFNPDDKEIRIVIIDEIHTYFPRGSIDKETAKLRDDLVSIFSQLRKRSTFILSTAQVYGRLDKALREQCLYMISCKVSIGNKLINDFIWGDDIICDELGRWAGNPRFIYKHGLPKIGYDTKNIIRE